MKNAMNVKFKLITLGVGMTILLGGCETVSTPVSNTPATQTYSNQHLLMQKGRDYNLDDYRNFDTASVTQCQQTCNNDGRCHAYTWTVPGYRNNIGMCYLKNWGNEVRQIPQATVCPECTSGVSAHFLSRMNSQPQIGVPRAVTGQAQRQQTQIEQRTTDEVNRRVDGAVNRVLDGIFGK